MSATAIPPVSADLFTSRSRKSPRDARKLAVHLPMAPLRIGFSRRRNDSSASTTVMAKRTNSSG